MNELSAAILNVDTLKHMNLRVLKATANELKVEMPPEGNSNHLGGVYAGAIFSLAEFPFGMLCVHKFGMREFVPVVGEVTIRYLAPATGALTVEVRVSDEEWAGIERETRARGKFKIVKEIEIKDAQGEVNAVAKATYFTVLLPKKI